MTILFEPDGDILYAIANDTMFKGKWYDELMFAELTTSGTVTTVKWEDDYMHPSHHSTLEEAKATILRDHMLHKPYVNGGEYSMEEDEL